MASEMIRVEEAVRRTLHDHGDVPAPELVALVEERFGVKVDPRFVPLIKATIRNKAEAVARRSATPGTGGGNPPGGPAGPDTPGDTGVGPSVR